MAQDYKVMCQFAGVDGSRDTDLELEEGQCKDSVGVRGQGSSPNPPSRFINHVVFWWNGQLYDPSYGLGAFDDIKQYESDVLRGFFEDRIGPAGETTYLSTNLKPNDGDNHDQSDLDLQYTVF